MSTARRNEQGFSLVELMAVIVVVAILMGLGFMSIRGARNTGSRTVAVASARAYEQAIDRFAASHGGRVPSVGTDWPTAAASAQEGPIANVMGVKKRYVRSIPEAVQDGRVLVGVGSAPAATPGVSSITYMIDGTGYRIEVRTEGRPACAIYGQGAAGGSGKPQVCGT